MKERIKGAFTKKKIFHFLKMALFVVALSLILLSLLGTVAHATGLVDDTINAENLYSKYPLSNYQLDFYVDNSWSWLPWNWLDGIGKSVQYGLYCITNFVWTISRFATTYPHRIMIRPHGAVLPTRMGIVEILTELSKAVCLLL